MILMQFNELIVDNLYLDELNWHGFSTLHLTSSRLNVYFSQTIILKLQYLVCDATNYTYYI